MGKATRGPGRPSPVYQWLEINYDGLAAAFRQASPSWTNLADYLSEHGVTGAEGRRLSPAAVRAAWLRVDKARRRGRSVSSLAEVSERLNTPKRGLGRVTNMTSQKRPS
jgi:hypothetical protein